MSTRRRLAPWLPRRAWASFLVALGSIAHAQAQQPAPPDAPNPKPGAIEEVVVIGATPTQGSEIDADKLPARIQIVTGAELEKEHTLAITDFLNQNLTGVSINGAQNNPLQPDVQYRGFSASPLLGLPQGIAVYQDGVRINEPLGDAVNWDLIPQSAISSVSLVGGSNPLFGLNTLGGALNLQMKNGFNYQGNELGVTVGSFGRRILGLQSGGKGDSFGYYFNAQYFDEDGFRDLSNSDALNLYGSLSYRGDVNELDLKLAYADTELRGNGTAPRSLLARERDGIFTGPDVTQNRMVMVGLDVRHALSDAAKISAGVFWRQVKTDSLNGDVSPFEPCPGNPAALCDEDGGDPLELGALPGGADLEDFDAIDNRSDRTQASRGVTLQFDGKGALFGLENQLISGISYFGGETGRFRSLVELARLDARRSTEHSPLGPEVLDQRTRAASQTQSYSSYFADSLSLGENLSLLLAGRYNLTGIEVSDHSGEHPEIDGRHHFRRFNPAVGFTYRLGDAATVYAGYSESSRAPTPIELSCNEGTFEIAEKLGIDADDCRLPNAFLADPPLEQVVAKSVEFGLRGSSETLDWSIGAFQTRNHDDIIFQSTGRSTGVFKNVDQTRRYGLEAELKGRWQHFGWSASYSFVRATFEDRFAVRSPSHPLAQDGLIEVERGDRIPGTPEHEVKLSADWNLGDRLSLGVEYLYNASQFLRGDESNQLRPVSDYAVVNLGLRYQPLQNFELSLRVENLFDREYETFGLLGERAEGLPGLGDVDDVRFLGPAASRGVFLAGTLRW